MRANLNYSDKNDSLGWKTDEALKEVNIQKIKTIKHGGANIMIWECFAWSGVVDNLAQIKGIITDDVLCENLEESLLKLDLENNFIFQQDNDPKHKAKKNYCLFQI